MKKKTAIIAITAVASVALFKIVHKDKRADVEYVDAEDFDDEKNISLGQAIMKLHDTDSRKKDQVEILTK